MTDFNAPKFKELQQKCNAKHLKLFSANSNYLANKHGGKLAVYCPFSKNQLLAANTLQEVADYFKIGGNYD
jgi:hypothetical protein